MPNLLLIDDDREMLEITSAMFREKEYEITTMTVGDKADVLVAENEPDCVILDVMMPGIDGFEVCERIRKVSSVPIIFVTGRVSESDKIKGLMIGADDYIEKPFSFRELEARTHAAIRRSQKSAPGKLLFPPLEIDINERRVLCDDVEIPLTHREYDILYFIVTSKKDVITFEDIGKKVWGVYREQDRQSVMVIISRLRKKLDINPVTARMIETVWSEGYRFIKGRR